MKKEILTPTNDRWEEFIDKLYVVLENSSCGDDLRNVESILTEMGGFDIPLILEGFELCGGFCDCEVLMNVEVSFSGQTTH